MSGIRELAEMGSIIIDLLDDFHFKAVFVDSRIASMIWTLRDSAREVINEIDELLLAHSENDME